MEVETIKGDVEMKIPFVQLDDIVSLSKGKKHLPIENGKNRYINIENLHNSANSLFTNEEGTFVVEDDLIIAWDGANAGKVGVGFAGVIGSTLARMRIKSTNVSPRYLFWYLESKNELIKSQRTGATIPHVNGNALKEIQIPLPPLATQKRIAEILDAADAIRRKDQELLKKYDELAQAIFIDMFGDPVKNEKGWDVRSLIDVAYSNDDVKCGPFGTQLSRNEYKTSGIPIWGIPQINSNFKKAPTEYVSVQKSNELKVYSVEKNDIVMSRKGNVGACALFPERLDVGILHSDAIRIRVNTNFILPEVLLWQFKMSRILQTQVSNVSSGAVMPGINVTKLKQVKVFVPDINSQKEFSLQLEFLEIQRSLLQNSINSSGNLFNTLIQKAFKGELVK